MGKKRISLPELKFRIQSRHGEVPIELVHYRGIQQSAIFKCKKCNHEWKRFAHYAVRINPHCPKCKPVKRYYEGLTEDVLMSRLREVDFTMKWSDYKGMLTKTHLRCLRCDQTVFTSPSQLIRYDSRRVCSCRKKTRNPRRTASQFIYALQCKGVGLEVSEEDFRASGLIETYCLKCGARWKAMPRATEHLKYPCKSKECCEDRRLHKKLETCQYKWRADEYENLTEEEELRRIDEGLEKLYAEKGWDGTYFWEK